MIDYIFKLSSSIYLKISNYVKKEQTKGKNKKITIWFSNIFYYIAIWLSKIIEKREISKLDYNKIRKYYRIYGKEDTLKKFKLTEEILERIV